MPLDLVVRITVNDAVPPTDIFDAYRDMSKEVGDIVCGLSECAVLSVA